MPTMYIPKKAKPRVIKPRAKRRPKLKPEVQNREAGDFENVKEGTVHVIDGIILFVKGMFKLLSFAMSTLIDGLKWIFDKDEKPKKKRKRT